MSAPRVWAPRAQRVEIVTQGARHIMEPAGPAGWWRASLELHHGDDYAFALDGGHPLPDPRSRWQPQGVHAASLWFDAKIFGWTDAAWRPPAWSNAIIYELHVGTFSPEGTFAGASARLDHLVQLGVTHVELMPVAEFPGNRGWGYDGVDLYAPHHAYGGPEGLQRLVNACHEHGLAVIFDVVYNHLGPVGNYLAQFGPYFTDHYHTPWGAAVNFDGPGSDEVRAFFIDNALSWLRDFHGDGLRLDAVHAIVDQSATPFLDQLGHAVRAEAARLGRELVLIAESDANDPRLSAPSALGAGGGGTGLNAQWDEDFHHALHAALTGEHNGYFQDFGSLAALAAALERGFYLDGRYSTYRQRRHGRRFDGSDASRLVVYAQNHDQTGNRAQGERLSHLLSPGLQRVAAALVLLSPGVPLLFQGEEWGAATPFLYFTDHDDPALAEAIHQGRQRECAHFGWPGASSHPNHPDPFIRSRLDWNEPAQPEHGAMLAWYRALIHLRRDTSLGTHDLHATQVAFDESRRWLVVHRGPHWRIACNLAREPQPVPLGDGAWSPVLASAPPPASAGLAPESVAVFRSQT